jgi:hypothetical protein
MACDATNPDAYPGPVTPEDDCPADLTTPEGYTQAVKCQKYRSCAFTCDGCSEHERPYQCPAMRSWSALPHAPACGSIEPPAKITGTCTATLPAKDALRPAGPDGERTFLPDGHWIKPAGVDQVLHPKDMEGGFPLNVITAGRFAVVTDSGIYDNALHVVDLDLLRQNMPALVSHVMFPEPAQLYDGLVLAAPDVIYASGGADGIVYAFRIDLQTGAIARTPEKDIELGETRNPSGRYYAGPMALSAGKLVVAPSAVDKDLRVIDPATKAIASIDLGQTDVFALDVDAFDPSGNTVYATSLSGRVAMRVDLAARAVTARFPTGKNPEGVVRVSSEHLVVASSDDDTLTLMNATTGAAVQTLDVTDGTPNGAQPGALTFKDGKLYVTLSGINAVGVYEYSGSALTPLGKVPTAWWPTAVRLAGSDLVVVTGKGRGAGADPTPYKVGGGGGVTSLTRGSIQIVPGAVVDTATVDASRKTTTAEGYPTVECPGSYDFPVPLTNTGAPSDKIKHVVYVLRENKTFDSVFGDVPGVRGDPRLVLSPGNMDDFWKNVRAIGEAFTIADNYYVDAEQSLQGHFWSTFGRSTDFVERTWTSTWGRGVRNPKAGIDRNIGYPSEGSLFLWAERHGIPYDDMGEIVGMGDKGFDTAYPGLVYTVALPDVEKACYVAARARALCDLKAITFIVTPNDHTEGLKAGSPAPEVMIAVNDEATGMIVDAISHSPMWKDTLIVITEDDPQNGGDHLDPHRTPMLLVSPWVKRGYVTQTHFDAASVHKLIAHVFAKPYQSEMVENAALPFDAFTSTPDYTPFTYQPRKVKSACNPAGTRGATRAQGWDFSDPDDQPGLAEQVDEYLRGLAR